MRVVLHVESEGRPRQTFWLRDNQCAEVGRIAWADLLVEDDPEIAEVHFALQCKDSACRIRDLSQSGGTFVNGKRVLFSELADGDEVKAGKTTFRVAIDDQTASVDCDIQTHCNRVNGQPQRLQAEPSSSLRDLKLSDQEPLSVVLKLESGWHSGCFVWMRDNQTLQVGRSHFADFAIEADARLEPLHFELVTDWSRCQLRRLSGAVNVLVNRQPMTGPVHLRNGDVIQAGDSQFAVRISGGRAAEEEDDDKPNIALPALTAPASAWNYSSQACTSELICYTTNDGQPSVLDVARRLAERRPMYLVINFAEAKLPVPDCLSADSDLLAGAANSPRAQRRLMLVSPDDPLDPYELWEQAMGKNAVVCLFAEQSKSDVMSSLRKNPVSFNAPGILYQHLAELPDGFARQVIDGIQAILVERDEAGDWAVLLHPENDGSWDELGFPNPPVDP